MPNLYYYMIRPSSDYIIHSCIDDEEIDRVLSDINYISNIEKLRFRENIMLSEKSYSKIFKMRGFLNLKEIELIDCYDFNDNTLFDLKNFAFMKDIKTLRFSMIKGITTSGYINFFDNQTMNNLTKLILCYNEQINDRVLLTISKHCMAKLTCLDLSYCQNITNQGLQFIADNMNNILSNNGINHDLDMIPFGLELFNISGCPQIDIQGLNIICSINNTSLKILKFKFISPKVTKNDILTLFRNKNLHYIERVSFDQKDDFMTREIWKIIFKENLLPNLNHVCFSLTPYDEDLLQTFFYSTKNQKFISLSLYDQYQNFHVIPQYQNIVKGLDLYLAKMRKNKNIQLQRLKIPSSIRLEKFWKSSASHHLIYFNGKYDHKTLQSFVAKIKKSTFKQDNENNVFIDTCIYNIYQEYIEKDINNNKVIDVQTDSYDELCKFKSNSFKIASLEGTLEYYSWFFLNDLSNLQELYIHMTIPYTGYDYNYNSLLSKDYFTLSHMINLSKIKLNIGNRINKRILDSFINALEIVHFPSMKYLSITIQNPEHNCIIAQLCQVPFFSQITTMKIQGNNFVYTDFRNFKALKKVKKFSYNGNTSISILCSGILPIANTLTEASFCLPEEYFESDEDISVIQFLESFIGIVKIKSGSCKRVTKVQNYQTTDNYMVFTKQMMLKEANIYGVLNEINHHNNNNFDNKLDSLYNIQHIDDEYYYMLEWNRFKNYYKVKAEYDITKYNYQRLKFIEYKDEISLNNFINMEIYSHWTYIQYFSIQYELIIKLPCDFMRLLSEVKYLILWMTKRFDELYIKQLCDSIKKLEKVKVIYTEPFTKDDIIHICSILTQYYPSIFLYLQSKIPNIQHDPQPDIAEYSSFTLKLILEILQEIQLQNSIDFDPISTDHVLEYSYFLKYTSIIQEHSPLYKHLLKYCSKHLHYHMNDLQKDMTYQTNQEIQMLIWYQRYNLIQYKESYSILSYTIMNLSMTPLLYDSKFIIKHFIELFSNMSLQTKVISNMMFKEYCNKIFNSPIKSKIDDMTPSKFQHFGNCTADNKSKMTILDDRYKSDIKEFIGQTNILDLSQIARQTFHSEYLKSEEDYDILQLPSPSNCVEFGYMKTSFDLDSMMIDPDMIKSPNTIFGQENDNYIKEKDLKLVLSPILPDRKRDSMEFLVEKNINQEVINSITTAITKGIKHVIIKNPQKQKNPKKLNVDMTNSSKITSKFSTSTENYKLSPKSLAPIPKPLLDIKIKFEKLTIDYLSMKGIIDLLGSINNIQVDNLTLLNYKPSNVLYDSRNNEVNNKDYENDNAFNATSILPSFTPRSSSSISLTIMQKFFNDIMSIKNLIRLSLDSSYLYNFEHFSLFFDQINLRNLIQLDLTLETVQNDHLMVLSQTKSLSRLKRLTLAVGNHQKQRLTEFTNGMINLLSSPLVCSQLDIDHFLSSNNHLLNDAIITQTINLGLFKRIKELSLKSCILSPKSVILILDQVDETHFNIQKFINDHQNINLNHITADVYLKYTDPKFLKYLRLLKITIFDSRFPATTTFLDMVIQEQITQYTVCKIIEHYPDDINDNFIKVFCHYNKLCTRHKIVLPKLLPYQHPEITYKGLNRYISNYPCEKMPFIHHWILQETYWRAMLNLQNFKIVLQNCPKIYGSEGLLDLSNHRFAKLLEDDDSSNELEKGNKNENKFCKLKARDNLIFYCMLKIPNLISIILDALDLDDDFCESFCEFLNKNSSNFKNLKLSIRKNPRISSIGLKIFYIQIAKYTNGSRKINDIVHDMSLFGLQNSDSSIYSPSLYDTNLICTTNNNNNKTIDNFSQQYQNLNFKPKKLFEYSNLTSPSSSYHHHYSAKFISSMLIKDHGIDGYIKYKYLEFRRYFTKSINKTYKHNFKSFILLLLYLIMCPCISCKQYTYFNKNNSNYRKKSYEYTDVPQISLTTPYNLNINDYQFNSQTNNHHSQHNDAKLLLRQNLIEKTRKEYIYTKQIHQINQSLKMNKIIVWYIIEYIQ